MAYMFKRSGSPYWWIGYNEFGKRLQKSTKLKHSVPADTRKAQAWRRDIEKAESSTIPLALEAWENWVPGFLRQRYGHTPITLQRYENSWRNISVYLRLNKIHVPRQLARANVRAFVDWRQERHGEHGTYECSKNTALHEIKLLRVVMFEAVALGYSGMNPCQKLGIRPDEAPLKPRITDVEHRRIMECLAGEPEWMRISYTIAWEQGCRFSETCLDLASQVDLKRGVIRFRTKGKKNRLTEFPLSPNLVPIFQSLIKKGERVTFDMPDMPGKAWWRFFRKIRLRHLCFHCTRVTFVTRCEEANLPPHAVMRLVGHSDYIVHRVYSRLQADHSTVQAMRQLLS